MKTLRRWLKQNARLRYWKRRALKAESVLDEALIKHAGVVAELRDSLEAERYRNMSREDTFVSATVMGGRNMFGVPPRTAPAMKQVGYSSTAMGPVDAWQALSASDKAEFETFYKPAAEANGVPIQQAKAAFLVEIAGRRALTDEPYNN